MKKKVAATFLFCSIFLSIFLFSQNITSNQTLIDPADRSRVEKFLKHIMIENFALYTLIGSKPMTAFSFVPIIDEQEKREIYDAKEESFRKYIPFEKFKPTREDCRKLWNDWKKVQYKYLGDQFLIDVDQEWEEGFLINIPSVVFILNKYYNEFAVITEQSFDPLKAVYLLGNSSEPFWQKIKKNHYLLGLLFGFGEKNARYFQWEHENKLKYPLRRGTCLIPGSTGKPAHELTVEDLDIPSFVVYQPVDEQEEMYKLEKENYIRLYKDQDFAELTISFLKGIKPKRKERELSQEAKKLIEERFWYSSTMK